MNHIWSNKNIGKVKEPWVLAVPTEVTGRQVPLTTMMEEGQGGWTEESIPASGVVWYVAPESATHLELTGGVSPMVLKERARTVGSQPTSPGEASEGGVHGDGNGGPAPANMAVGGC